MSIASSSFERTKVVDLAREYKSRGYRVVVEPAGDDVPPFLQAINFRPDLIATSGKENLIIEVKSRESIRDAQYLAEISEIVKEIENWEFLLVYTNPKRKPELSVLRETQKRETIRESLSAVSAWIEKDAPHPVRMAALLLLWSIIEASMTAALPEKRDRSRVRTPLGLIRDTAIAGILSKGSHQFLERIMKKRNEVAHGNLSQSVTYQELTKIIAVCEEILAENDG